MGELEIEKIIREYLPDIIHMSLATCLENKPWVCEVHFSYDKELNIYFRSRPSTRHCQELNVNPNVSGNIVVQHKLGEKPRGVYFSGIAEKLSDVDEKHLAFNTYSERFSLGPEILLEPGSDNGHDFYMINVTDWFIFDARESNPSQKYHLAWKS